MEDNLSAPATETTVTDIPATVDSAPPADSATPDATPEAPKSRRDLLADAFNKPQSNRGKHAAYQPRDSGKFAPGAPQKPVEAPIADPAAVLAAPDHPLPKSLKKEYETHWKQTPAELRAALVQREADYEKGITNYRTQAQDAQAVLDQFKPYEWILKNEGATPQTAISPLLQTAAILRTGTPAQKAQSVAQVMQQFGIPMEHVQQLLSGQAQASQGSVADPQYNALAQQVQQLQQFIQQSQHGQQQQFEQRALSVIQQFAADPKNIHFDAVQDKMVALLQAPQVIGIQDGMSEREKLETAYRAAVRLDPNLAAQELAQQQAATEAKKREQAQAAANTARAAAVQVRGAPGSPIQTTVDPNNRRDVIANALRASSN